MSRGGKKAWLPGCRYVELGEEEGEVVCGGAPTSESRVRKQESPRGTQGADGAGGVVADRRRRRGRVGGEGGGRRVCCIGGEGMRGVADSAEGRHRSEEHTSELQSR